jgi:hypothetical protein
LVFGNISDVKVGLSESKHKKRKRILIMHKKTVTLLASLLLSIGLTGCGSAIVLHPIAKQDIVIMKKGQNYAPDRDGYFLSNLYFDEVLKAKVEKINLK